MTATSGFQNPREDKPYHLHSACSRNEQPAAARRIHGSVPLALEIKNSDQKHRSTSNPVDVWILHRGGADPPRTWQNQHIVLEGFADSKATCDRESG